MRRALGAVPFALALAQMLLHLLCGTRYGIFRDELYYWDCANHLAWGYVDHPPLSIAILAAWKGVFGDSLLSMHVLPALVGGVLILIAARVTARLGGGAVAQALAALITFAVPSYLGITGVYSMNAFELLFWFAGFLILIDLIEGQSRRAWIALGVCVGLGLLNKISVAVFALGAGVALLAATRARVLATRGPYVAMAMALALFSPHIAWQIANGWPTREFIANAQRYKMTAMRPLSFLGGVAMEMGPTMAPLLLAGLVILVVYRPLRRFRPLAWTSLAALAVFALNRSKPYYAVPVFLPLVASCAIGVEALARRRRLVWVAPLVAVHAVAAFAFMTPFAIPLLPVDTFIAYQDAIGIRPSSGENRESAELPQFFADRFGWEELAAQVGAVFDALPPDDRAACLIVGQNYGEAGAINYFGRRLGLPRAVSQHNSYYLWGHGLVEPKVYVIVGQDREGLEATFTEVHEVARTNARYAMPDETGVPIWVCRGIRMPLDEAWRRGRMFI
jgi:hypothetical protein